jgi:hypothetical protein
VTARNVTVWRCDRCGKEITELKSNSYYKPMFHISLKVGRSEPDPAMGEEHNIYAFRDMCHQCAEKRWQLLEKYVFEKKGMVALIPILTGNKVQADNSLSDPDGKDVPRPNPEPKPFTVSGTITGEEREGRA